MPNVGNQTFETKIGREGKNSKKLLVHCSNLTSSINPVHHLKRCSTILTYYPNVKVVWEQSGEFNVFKVTTDSSSKGPALTIKIFICSSLPQASRYHWWKESQS